MVMDLFSKETEGWFILSLAGRKYRKLLSLEDMAHREVHIVAGRSRQRIAQSG